jgi:putative inorganic carbon (HCO3(-)) transporter
MYFVARNFFSLNKEKSGYLMAAAVIAAAVLSLDGFYQYIYGKDLFRGFKPDVFFEGSATLMTKRITASMKYPTDCGMYLTFALPFSLAFFSRSKRMAGRIFFGLIVLLISGAIMLTYTRAAWVTIFPVILFFAFLLKRKLILIWLLPFALFLFFAPRTATLIRTIQPQTFIDGSLRDRITYGKEALELISRNIFLGNGINTYDRLNKELHPGKEKYAYAHNCYLQMWAELGLIGLGVFAAFLIALFRRSVLAIKRENGGILARGQGMAMVCMCMGLVVLVVSFFFDTHFYNTPLSVLFWYTCGVTAALAA